MLIRVRVWDLPTRVFHWLLVSCFVGSIVSAEIAGDAMVWHFRFGYSIVTLLLFRLVWGFVGGYWSRFNHFLRGPTAIWQYLTEDKSSATVIGHNPLGALSVLAVLGLLLLQVGTGLCSDDEIATAGPLVPMVAERFVRVATWYHTSVGKVLLIVWVQLHLAAMFFYRWKHKLNLVHPMITGDQLHGEVAQGSRDNVTSRLVALAIFTLCAMLVAAFVRWAT